MRILILTLSVAAACSPTAPKPTTPSPSPSPSPSPISSSSVSDPPKTSDLPVVAPDPQQVKAPLFSDDDCNRDADCVPVATCHPDRCVLPANTGKMPAGMMCTMDCRGGTLDCNFNHCGCGSTPSGAKKCAVLAGPAPKKP